MPSQAALRPQRQPLQCLPHAYSLAERGEMPRLLALVSKAGFRLLQYWPLSPSALTVVLELFPRDDRSRPALYRGFDLPAGVDVRAAGPARAALCAPTAMGRIFPAMAGFPWLTGFGLLILAAIFVPSS